jgi:GT2 family glycosyltransferase
MSHKVAIIIVNFNGGEVLQRSLKAIEKQTVKPSRTIVIDNCSQDNSATQCQALFPDIEFYFQDKNHGFAKACNIGIELATDCDWVALLNPDAFPRPDWLEKLLAAGELNEKYSSFASKMLISGNENRIDGAGDVYHVSGLAWRRFHGVPDNRDADISREVFSPCAGAALYKRQPLIDVGGFDEDFFCYMEDVDLGFRLRLAGHCCFYVADAIVEHIGSAIAGKHSDFQLYHGHRNLEWVYFKNMPGWLLGLTLPLHLLLTIFSLAYFSVRGRWRPVFKAKRDAFADIAELQHKREGVQRNSKASFADIWRMLDKRLFRFSR